MSLERFSRHSPEANNEPSIIQLADELIYHCRESLLERGKTYPSIPTYNDEKEFWSSTIDEHAGIWVGNLFIEIELSMQKGVFDLLGFIERTKHDLRGTPLNTGILTLPNRYPDLVEIDRNNLARMRITRNEDKTLAKFLKDKNALPFEVEDYLANDLKLLGSRPLLRVLNAWELRANKALNTTTTAQMVTDEEFIDPLSWATPEIKLKLLKLKNGYGPK